MTIRPSTLAAAGISAFFAARILAQQPVLMISVDGMRPDYVTAADAHHLRIPTLRRMLAQGTHATGVQGVLPTVTYPSHTTLVTGVSPAQHGILNNPRFDPGHKLDGAWYWYAPLIQVPTLWSAAQAAGLSTASVSWPVTADASAIDTLIPEYWRTSSPAEAFNPDDRLLLDALSRPSGELARIATRTHTPYMMGNDTTTAGDAIRTLYSLDILKQHKPRFMTIHLSSLDEYEHLHGPFSPEANAALEAIDADITRLAAQELENYPNAVIAIVSDHGFAGVKKIVSLNVPFVQAGLITLDKSGKLATWKAYPWTAGGVAAVMLHDPSDTATLTRVQALLTRLAANPANGILSVLDAATAARRGGFPGASFVVTMQTGYVPGPAFTGPLVDNTPLAGMHGFDPTTSPEMRASLFLTGQGIAPGKDLGIVDMRQIAPTLASILAIPLPTATQPTLPIH